MDQTALVIKSKCLVLNSIRRFLVSNCTFKSLNTDHIIKVVVSPANNDISFLNCTLHNNIVNNQVIKISIPQYTPELSNHNIGCYVVNNQMFGLTTTNISFIKCKFKNNSGEVLMI